MKSKAPNKPEQVQENNLISKMPPYPGFQDQRAETIQQLRIMNASANNSRTTQLKSTLHELKANPWVSSQLKCQQLIQNQNSTQSYNPGSEKNLASTKPIQKVKLNLRNDNTISGISKWPGRPTSNLRGKQGQHLTAYVVFEDTMLSHTVDKTPAEAAKSLYSYLHSIYSLPGMQKSSGNYLHEYIEAEKSNLQNAKGDPVIIGNIIDTILSIRNKVPDTAEQGVGGGHGEASQSGSLVQVEKILRTNTWTTDLDEDVVASQSLYSMWRLLSYEPASPQDKSELEDIGKKVLTHFISLKNAYPHTFEWLSSKQKYWLFPYLEKNRTQDGMPLQGLTPKELGDVANFVYSGL